MRYPHTKAGRVQAKGQSHLFQPREGALKSSFDTRHTRGIPNPPHRARASARMPAVGKCRIPSGRRRSICLPAHDLALLCSQIWLFFSLTNEARSRSSVLFALRRLFDKLKSAYMSEIADRPFNHHHVSITELHPPVRSPSSLRVPAGMKINARRQMLGTGRQARILLVQHVPHR